MSANCWLENDSENASSNGENNYSEHNDSETEDVNTESETKSAHSHTDSYSNEDVVIDRFENVISTEKHLLDYHVVPNVHSVDDSRPTKSTSLRKTCCTITTLLIGLLLFAWGLVTVAVPIYDFVRIERLKMQPGFPPFEQWVVPTPEVRLNVYIFTVANPDAFLDGTDKKLRLIEIGPIVYREHLHHQNVIFHENSTLSYTAHRTLEFLEDQNEKGILDRVIQVPNFVLLATAASLNDQFWGVKSGFTWLLQDEDSAFLNMTVQDYLWYYKSNILHRVGKFAPFLVPTNNSGCLYQIYSNFEDRYNVRIGPGYDFDHFFEITSMNGQTQVPGFTGCNASIVGSTEGALYKNQLTEESVLWYWRKPLCRQVPLYYEKRVQKGSFEAYKYVLRENVYDRSENLTKDCYKGSSQLLPNGFSDVSKCFYELPIAASNPHYYGRYPNRLTEKLEGLKPDRDRHQSYIIIEPIMGVPIDQSARSQSNVIIPNLDGFNDDIHRFSNMALPTFWVEYRQRELTPAIENILYFTLFILPVLQYVITAFLLTMGITCLTIGVLRCMERNGDKYKSNSMLNGGPKFENNYKLHVAKITWNLK